MNHTMLSKREDGYLIILAAANLPESRRGINLLGRIMTRGGSAARRYCRYLRNPDGRGEKKSENELFLLEFLMSFPGMMHSVNARKLPFTFRDYLFRPQCPSYRQQGLKTSQRRSHCVAFARRKSSPPDDEEPLIDISNSEEVEDQFEADILGVIRL